MGCISTQYTTVLLGGTVRDQAVRRRCAVSPSQMLASLAQLVEQGVDNAQVGGSGPSLGFSDKEKITRVMEQNNIAVLILDKNSLSWQAVSKALNP